MQYRESVGCYQVDETQGDIYLVSKWDRSKVIGRPNVYLAIDTASGLIAGLYVGLDAGETAMWPASPTRPRTSGPTVRPMG